MGSQKFLQHKTVIPNCIRIEGGFFEDQRGCFQKVFSPEIGDGLPEQMVVREMFWSESTSGVIRGMHFQLPPAAVRKIVWVSSGSVSDVVLDLRRGSPTYGKAITFELNCSSGAVYIPIGCAHGFEVLSQSAIVNYAQDRGFDPICDSGIKWNSFGYRWAATKPIISARDQELTPLESFETPFVFQEI
ncbi:MAG: dTDP-4-keto-6-deoxy-D-glucose epimerase [Actinobacteria bacterium]|jgi:dTDP-4-dehydrorhamnose 3,5-epimerase|nr:dTDP-4-keto-6-deoxy-D-glucose epimerase [Actinomycetota bacterium]